ncbi:unnamed protein product [Schistocephalus solidus]|uniref:C2H2-type domain-containing protein n=1 Tax=Schistocephalus solidus TaxID=70667 RepID=A0A183SK53_SCHSO|nr:unnamed protein product [Schistocephalus solidus]
MTSTLVTSTERQLFQLYDIVRLSSRSLPNTLLLYKSQHPLHPEPTFFKCPACPMILLSSHIGRHMLAINASTIATFGTRSLSRYIGLRRVCSRDFFVSHITCANLGADFLTYYELMVDCLHTRLHD